MILTVPPRESYHPLTIGRELTECPAGTQTLVEALFAEIEAAGFQVGGIEDTCGETGELPVYIEGNAWVHRDDLAKLREPAADRRPSKLTASNGKTLAFTTLDRIIKMPPPPVQIEASEQSFHIVYPWDLLKLHEQLLARIDTSDIQGSVAEGATITGPLVLGRDSRVLPGVYTEGTVVIGRNCKIGPNCYLRGPLLIGDDCHIGQAVELKASVIMEDTSIAHLSYAGDSIIGAHVNLGAGTIIANFRHDGKNHRSMVGRRLVDTGRRKFGAILGDHVHTGIHTSIYPGRKLWPHTSTRPGTIVQRDLRDPE